MAEYGLGLGWFALPVLGDVTHYGPSGNGFGYITAMIFLEDSETCVSFMVNDGLTVGFMADELLEAVIANTWPSGRSGRGAVGRHAQIALGVSVANGQSASVSASPGATLSDRRLNVGRTRCRYRALGGMCDRVPGLRQKRTEARRSSLPGTSRRVAATPHSEVPIWAVRPSGRLAHTR